MQISTIANGSGRTLRIRTNENLDLQQHGIFSKAAIVADYTLIDDIEIDLENTRIIRDSGLALLLMLSRKSKSGCIRILNCPKDLQKLLSMNNSAGYFQIV